MPDGIDRVEEIERRIDREVAGAVALASHPSGAVTVAPRNMSELFEFAKLMAVSGPCVRGAFRGNPGACLALAMQAFKWGADPFAVANKAYIVKNRGTGEDQIAYEAQLVHAIINTRAPLQQRLRTSYSGEGTKRSCTVTGLLIGEAEPFEYVSPKIEEIAVKNSPLWTADRDQQLHYYSTRAWARRWCPEILLGIYTPEETRGEIIDIEARDISPPRPRPEDFAEHTTPVETETQSFEIVDFVGEAVEFPTAEQARDALLEMIGKAGSLSVLETLWTNNIDAIATIGEALDHGRDDPLNEAFSAAQEAFSAAKEASKQQSQPNPGDRQDHPAAGAQSPDPARGVTPSAEPGHNEHPEGTPTPQGERTEAQQLPASGAATPDAAVTPSNESPRDEPNSLHVPVRKPAGKNADWQGTALDMVDVIIKLTNVDDVTPTGPFMHANRATLDLMRVGDKSAWSTVMYRLGDRERQLRSGEQ
jgi:hypothetical protein